MRFSIVNLGCKVNRVESDFYGSVLLQHGHEHVAEDAELVVVNTCTVTGEAEKKTRKAVRQALRRHPRALVVVTGCAVAINPEAFESMSPRVQVAQKADAVARLEEFYSASSPIPSSGDDAAVFASRTRVGIKVQDGCDNACTYCIVHVARGRASSVSAESVRVQAVRLAQAGVREIVLTGINIGSYDDEGRSLADLLEDLLVATEHIHEPGKPPVRFRVSSIEPMDVSRDLIALMARSQGRICRHLHIPLQAGSSRVLREMARPYDACDFKELIDSIRAEVPEISLTTDIIVGFPGETEEDFVQTCELARYCGFSKIHVFPYSRREGTPAAARADQVPPDVSARRAAKLRELSDALRKQDYAHRAGANEYVLVEQTGRAMTESYYEVEVSEGIERGELACMTLPAKPLVDTIPS